jgi:hypothetical protein
MKIVKNSSGTRGWIAWLTGSALALCFGAILSNTAKSDDLPGLSIRLLTNNQLQLTVTNSAATNRYEIQRRRFFDLGDPWHYQTNGTAGQSNFTVGMGVEQIGFFRAIPCVDCDNDGAENWQDADPHDPAVGLFTVTIDRPANGSTIP